MKTVKKILDELQSTNGKNEKQEIIKRNLDNELFVEVMKFLLDDFIVTGISDKKIMKNLSGTIEMNHLRDISQVIEYLKSHNTGSDNDIATIQRFIFYQSDDLVDTYVKIFTKSLKLGVSASTFNKCVSKELRIPTFEVMLAYSYFDYEHKVTGEFIITKKFDGNRVVAIKDKNEVKFFTRNGKTIEGLNYLTKEFDLLPDNMVYDGELLLRNSENLTSKDLFQATMKETRKKGDKIGLEFHCFDLLPISEFKLGKSNLNCIDRKIYLQSLLNRHCLKWIKEVPILYIGKDKNKIEYFLNISLDNEEEGIMINIADAKYQCKRTKDILKVKVMQTIDLKVIDFEEGQGQNKGTLGAVVAEYKNNVIKIGSGFKLLYDKNTPIEYTRDYIWNNKEKFKGVLCEVSYFEETINSVTGLPSLRFPIFKSWRWDLINDAL